MQASKNLSEGSYVLLFAATPLDELPECHRMTINNNGLININYFGCRKLPLGEPAGNIHLFDGVSPVPATRNSHHYRGLAEVKERVLA
jgi:hypothetical protein